MDNGKLKMENGKRKVENDDFPNSFLTIEFSIGVFTFLVVMIK
jgi:hypothetical protein